jgi:hypothetical protein
VKSRLQHPETHKKDQIDKLLFYPDSKGFEAIRNGEKAQKRKSVSYHKI